MFGKKGRTGENSARCAVFELLLLVLTASCCLLSRISPLAHTPTHTSLTHKFRLSSNARLACLVDAECLGWITRITKLLILGSVLFSLVCFVYLSGPGGCRPVVTELEVASRIKQ